MSRDGSNIQEAVAIPGQDQVAPGRSPRSVPRGILTWFDERLGLSALRYKVPAPTNQLSSRGALYEAVA